MLLWNCLLRPSVDACLALSRLAPCAGAPLGLGRVVLFPFFKPQCGGPGVDLSVAPSATHATASMAQAEVSVLSETYTHTHIHTYTHIHPHWYTQTYKHKNIQTYKHTNVQTYKHTNIQTYKHTNIQTYKHTNIHAWLVLLVTTQLALCSLPWLAGLECSAFWPVWTRRTVARGVLLWASVFSAQLGSTVDTCGASVYEALGRFLVLSRQCGTVEVPQFVLPSSVSVHGRLSSGNGFSEAMDYEHFWRR